MDQSRESDTWDVSGAAPDAIELPDGLGCCREVLREEATTCIRKRMSAQYHAQVHLRLWVYIEEITRTMACHL